MSENLARSHIVSGGISDHASNPVILECKGHKFRCHLRCQTSTVPFVVDGKTNLDQSLIAGGTKKPASTNERARVALLMKSVPGIPPGVSLGFLLKALEKELLRAAVILARWPASRNNRMKECAERFK
jgi:hypothetical protein